MTKEMVTITLDRYQNMQQLITELREIRELAIRFYLGIISIDEFKKQMNEVNKKYNLWEEQSENN